MTIDLVLLIAAFICFVAEAVGIKSRVVLGWVGLALWVLTAIL